MSVVVAVVRCAFSMGSGTPSYWRDTPFFPWGPTPHFFENFLAFTHKKIFKMAQETTSNDTPPLFSSISRREDDAFESRLFNIQLGDAHDADGGESDEEGEELELISEEMMRAQLERKQHEGDFHVKEVSNGDIGFVLCKREGQFDEGNEDDLFDSIPKPPDDWIRPPMRAAANQLNFEDVDNPGEWNDYIFKPVFEKGQYVRHELPTGCTPVPLDVNGERKVGGWNFYYGGWKSERPPEKTRNGATPANLFPKERESTLDGNILKELGLNRSRIFNEETGEPDSLFFFQLILPLCDPKQSGIRGDPRKGYYTEVTNFSNLYKYQTGAGMTYGHKIEEIKQPEYVRFDGCVVRDGVRGGGDGALYRRWQRGSSSSDDLIQNSMTLERWVQLKRVLKLCNNDTAKKRTEQGYDPCYKYSMIFDVIVQNTIALTKKGELDLTGDETSWGHQGFGEKGGGNLFRVANKPGISKGGQTVLISATNRIRPYFVQHRHKFNPRYPPGMNAAGPAEVRTVIDALERMVVGREGESKKIFPVPPHITFDNFFSGEPICQYAGEKGFGLLLTTRRDRLPKGVKGIHFHKKKTESSHRTKVARYIEPVVAVKKNEEYDIVHCSFQSTSSCNIMSVNSLGEVKNFVELRTRGRKDKKRKYAIEQNMARLVYLNTYSRIDSIDHLIKNCNLFYVSWKYWHSPKNHALSLAIVTAYDIYLEICEGKIDPNYRLQSPVSFFTFRDVLSKQMCQYNPVHQLYPGDEKMRAVTQLHIKKRKRSSVSNNNSTEKYADGTGKITREQYMDVRRRQQRFCTMESYGKHLASIVTHKHPARCAVCSAKAYKKCGICGVTLHNGETRGEAKGKQCFIQWHDESLCGLHFGDRALVGVGANDWKEPTIQKKAQNKRLIKSYK